MTDDLDDFGSAQKPLSAWQRNHGNVLLAVMGCIFLVGSAILANRQLRFQKPDFPDGESIADPNLLEAGQSGGQVANRISIQVRGVSKLAGKVLIAVYDSRESFNDPAQAILRDSVQVASEVTKFSLALDKLPAKFAVAAFHDEDGDGVLSKYLSGFPKEKYGFSNNARSMTGPPNYEQAQIDRPAANGEIVVTIK